MRKACKLVLIDVDVTIDVKKPHRIIVTTSKNTKLDVLYLLLKER